MLQSCTPLTKIRKSRFKGSARVKPKKARVDASLASKGQGWRRKRLSQVGKIGDLVDSHCHLDFKSFDRDREEVIAQARRVGVAVMINSGVDYATNQTTLELARKHDFIHATMGIGPSSVDRTSRKGLQLLFDQIREHASEIKGVGEAGLDYYRCTDAAGRMRQAEVFQHVIELARELNLPLVIHARQAEDEAFKMVQSLTKVVFHCYGGNLETMQKIVDRGFYISLATTACYSAHHQILARHVPLESLLIETDAPFLSPRRGRNEPAYILDLVDQVARIKATSPIQIAEITARNARQAFDL